ncbi:MAG: DUF2127 domain-containing protein [Verrucomicrobiota bacterium]|jgi:uncharacterized membrane protein (DUF2068 family)
MSDVQKNLAVMVPEPKPKRAPTLYFIVAVKLLKGVAALTLAIISYSLTDNNLPEDFRKLLEFFHIDPEKKFFLEVANRISEITPSNLNWLAVFSVIYGLFMLLQAVGLAMRVSWVVWLVIAESAFFIPIEVFELVRKRMPNLETHRHLLAHPKIEVAVILAVNVAIVWYLFKNRERIIRHHPPRQ